MRRGEGKQIKKKNEICLKRRRSKNKREKKKEKKKDKEGMKIKINWKPRKLIERKGKENKERQKEMHMRN